MASKQLHSLGFWALVALATAVFFAWYGPRARRRRQLRHAAWQELCLRLELVPVPGADRVASGRQQGVDFRLRDTGSALLLEVPLPRPVLPPGVVLLSPRARQLRPPDGPRRLRLRSAPRDPLEWYAAPKAPPAEVLAPQAFLDTARGVLKAHAPLRVELDRLVHELPPSALFSVNEVRDAVHALHASAQRCSGSVDAHERPQVEPLPLLPSSGSLLRGVVARRGTWQWLLAMNGALPFVVAALLREWTAAFVVLLVVYGIGLFVWSTRRFGTALGLGLCALAGMASFAAPIVWVEGAGEETSPSIIWLRDAPRPEYRKASYFRFHDATVPNYFPPIGVTPSVTPVLPRDWRRGEPITVWATKRPLDSRANAALLGGRVVKPTRENRLREAAIETALFHKFPIHAHAIWLDMSVDPDEARANHNRLPFLLWSGPNGLWLGWVLVAWVLAFRKSRRPRVG